MDTMVTLTDRISLLKMRAGVTTLKGLADAVGLKNPQVFSDILSGKTSGFSGKVAGKIFLAFPEIRREWLLEGEGPMTADESPERNLSGDFLKIFLNMSETLNRLSRENEELKKKVAESESAPKKGVVGL
ncbi:MAG: hypothetical protein K6E61_03345 [Bacteroidales bacterium]|nr:hypothetical protein [Bacteroidales bacterium]